MRRKNTQRILLTGFVLTAGLVALSLYATPTLSNPSTSETPPCPTCNGRPIGIELQMTEDGLPAADVDGLTNDGLTADRS